MRLDLLGLDLAAAQEILRKEGISPLVTITNAPKRADEVRGTLRVISASGDGAQLTVARFLDPIEDAGRNPGTDGV